MAADGERRMLFDMSGKRRNVIRVVYAILALLMAGSLFLVVGPFNLGELVGNQNPGGDAAKIFHEQSERIEQRLEEDPGSEQELLLLTRARINAGNSQIEVSASGQPESVPVTARRDFDKALEAWNRYLKAVGSEPNASAAQLVAVTFFTLAETAESVSEAEANVKLATEAQQIAAAQRPSVGSLTTLAIYQYFNGEFAAGDATTKRAKAEATSKGEAKAIDKQLAQYRGNAKQFDKQKRESAKAEAQLGGSSQNPFELPGGGSLAE